MAGMSKTSINMEPSLRVHFPRADELKECINDPNSWFVSRFPEEASQYGVPFLVALRVDQDGLTHVTPAYLNDDFFCALIRVHLQTVYFEPEQCWYYFDPVPDAYCPTSPAKLQLLLSNYLIRCAEDCGPLVDVTNLVVNFRKAEVLEGVIRKARAMNQCDDQFFMGEKGNRRLTNGRIIEPTDKPSYELFVERHLKREDCSALTVTETFARYYSFCKKHNIPPLTRADFKSMMIECVREHFDVNFRKDVPARSGKVTQGWFGIGLQEAKATGLN
jgi:hypothetical protein